MLTVCTQAKDVRGTHNIQVNEDTSRLAKKGWTPVAMEILGNENILNLIKFICQKNMEVWATTKLFPEGAKMAFSTDKSTTLAVDLF